MQPTKTAAQLHEEKEKIISLLLHDLRPPLQVLRFLTGHLSGGNGAAMTPEMMRGYMEEFNMAVSELVQSSSAIFTWLEVQRDRFAGKPEPVALNEFLHKTLRQFKEETPQHSAEFMVAPTTDTALTDRGAVQTILIQLLRNANHAAQGGTVVLKGNAAAGKLVLSVSDSGKGIGKQVAENIQSHLHGGYTGPVLYRYGYRIIIEVVRLLNGQIEFDTEGGTTVTVILPVQA